MPTATSPAARTLDAPLRRVARVQRLAFALVVLTLATVVSPRAHAAVPMCGEHAQTVAAPPMILPWHKVTLEAPAPCPRPSDLLALSLPEHQPRSPSSPPAPASLRAVPVRGSELPEPPAAREPIASFDQPHGCELVSTVYRPPRH